MAAFTNVLFIPFLKAAKGYSTWIAEDQRWSQEADGLGLTIHSHGGNYQGFYREFKEQRIYLININL